MYQELGGVRACSIGILGLNWWSSVAASPGAEKELRVVRRGKRHRLWKKVWESRELSIDLEEDDDDDDDAEDLERRESGLLRMIAMLM